MPRGGPNEMLQRFLTPVEVSESFQVPVRTIQTLARAKKIPALKVGRLWRFRLSDVQRWIESNYRGDANFPEAYRKALEITAGQRK